MLPSSTVGAPITLVTSHTKLKHAHRLRVHVFFEASPEHGSVSILSNYSPKFWVWPSFSLCFTWVTSTVLAAARQWFVNITLFFCLFDWFHALLLKTCCSEQDGTSLSNFIYKGCLNQVTRFLGFMLTFFEFAKPAPGYKVVVQSCSKNWWEVTRGIFHGIPHDSIA